MHKSGSARPFQHLAFEPAPSVMEPFCMKGSGRAGTFGAQRAISDAVRDALVLPLVVRVDMPISPVCIWHCLQEADTAA